MDLKLNVLLGMIDRATAPLRSITGSAARVSKELRDTQKQLKDLNKAQADLQGFRNLKQSGQTLATQLRAAQTQASKLGKELAATAAPTRAQTREFDAARRKAAQLAQQHQANTQRLQAMRAQLSAAGISTTNLSQHQRQLQASVASANQQLAAQQQRLTAITAQQRKMAAVRQSYQQSQATAAHLAIGGAASMGTGHHILAEIRPAIDEAKAFQTQAAQLRSQGVGDAMVDDAVKFARGMDVMGSSATENLKLLKEANSVLRDMHESEQVTPYLARMKYGIETVMSQSGHGEGHGDTAEAMFMDLIKVAELRGAAKNPESLKRVLDFATQAYVSSGGLVKPEDLLNMIKTGGVAAKQLDDKTFFFGLLHTMQEMGGHRAGTGLATAYQNWAAGRTTQQSAEELAQLGLLNRGAVKYGTTGHVKKLLPEALKDGDLYRNNPFQFLMEKVVPKINPTGALNDQQVITKINALFSGRKGGDLFASLYMERANIAKHMAAAPKAFGVDALYDEASKTAQGQELDLEAKRRDLYRELGTQLLPLYVAGLSKLVAITRTLTAWTERHPQLAKGFMVVAATIGVLMIAVGGLMVALGALVGQFALLRFVMRMGGLKIGGGSGVGLLPRLLTFASEAMAALGAVSLPVLAIVAAITAAVIVAALVVRKYWGPISAWFQGIGEGIGNALGPVLTSLGEALGPLKPAWDLVAGAIASVWHWVTQLLEPFQATKEQLDGARQNGLAFGEAIGYALGGVIKAITFGVRLFVDLGVAIGNAAGWVVSQWGPVSTWFGDLWGGIKSGAETALNWISEKLAGVRAVIDAMTEAWRRLHGDTAPAMGQTPIQWIMPGDADRAHQVAMAIGRNPMPGSGMENAAGGGPSIVRPSPITTGVKGGAAVAGDSVAISIDARGMEPHHVRTEVRNALADHERDKQARARSAYQDQD